MGGKDMTVARKQYLQNGLIALGMVGAILIADSAFAANGSVSVQYSTPGAGSGSSVWKILTQLVSALAWPIAVVIIACRFKEPLSKFLAAIGSRVNKLSAFNMEIGLADVQSPSIMPAFEGPNSLARGADLNESSVHFILQASSTEPADYVLIQIGSGDEWLTSRLFLAAALLERMRGISVFVLVERTEEHRRRFVANIDARLLRWTLAQTYPWFETNFAEAYANESKQASPSLIVSGTGAMEQWVVGRIVVKFVQQLQKSTSRKPTPSNEYVELDDKKPTKKWEHAQWVTRKLLMELLPESADRAVVTEMSDQPRSKQARAILRCPAPFVAIVDNDRNFLKLVNRQAYLEKIAESMRDEPE